MISVSLFVFRMKAQRCIATKQCEVMWHLSLNDGNMLENITKHILLLNCPQDRLVRQWPVSNQSIFLSSIQMYSNLGNIAWSR
jgi:hypothetical protein